MAEHNPGRREGERGHLQSAPPAARTAAPSQLRVFTAIPVVPPRELYYGGILVDGGPVWPDFESSGEVRFNRDGPVDKAPKPWPVPQRTIDVPCVWGGFVQRHFGHLVADHMTRLVESLAERPDDTYLFVTYPGGSARDIPEYFWQVADWYGLPRRQIMLVTEPVLAAELRCAPQAERLGMAGPSERYLDLLDATTQRNSIDPVRSDVLYVGRTGLMQRGKGGHAGETYVVSLLESLGVAVLDPARAPLAEQLARYAGAGTLVFAEGSAMHGRQLLGRVPQDIVVLKRRKQDWLAREALTPRCRMLRYVEAASTFVAPVSADGRILSAEGISFYDTEALFSCFRKLGIDLPSLWSDEAYLRARAADTADWLRYSGRFGRLSRVSVAALSGAFAEVGLQSLLAVSQVRRMDWQFRAFLLKTVSALVRKKKPWSN
jgi:hypothetical protein